MPQTARAAGSTLLAAMLLVGGTLGPVPHATAEPVTRQVALTGDFVLEEWGDYRTYATDVDDTLRVSWGDTIVVTAWSGFWTKGPDGDWAGSDRDLGGVLDPFDPFTEGMGDGYVLEPHVSVDGATLTVQLPERNAPGTSLDVDNGEPVPPHAVPSVEYFGGYVGLSMDEDPTRTLSEAQAGVFIPLSFADAPQPTATVPIVETDNGFAPASALDVEPGDTFSLVGPPGFWTTLPGAENDVYFFAGVSRSTEPVPAEYDFIFREAISADGSTLTLTMPPRLPASYWAGPDPVRLTTYQSWGEDLRTIDVELNLVGDVMPTASVKPDPAGDSDGIVTVFNPDSAATTIEIWNLSLDEPLASERVHAQRELAVPFDGEPGDVIRVISGSRMLLTHTISNAPREFISTPVPVISGTATVGSTLTATTAVWTPAATFQYQWNAGGASVAGATSASYTPTAAEAGKTISVTVTGARDGYTSVSTTSPATASVALGSFTAAPTPTISGSVKVGSTLTANAGSWSPAAAVTYRWYADGFAIAGASSSTYVLTAAELRKSIAVAVSGTKAGYSAATRTSAATVAILPGTFTSTPTPTISGTAKVGSKLTAKPGTWAPGASFKYQWYANNAAISGATSSSYTLTSTQLGKKVTVKVTGSRIAYTSVAKTSAATATIARGTFRAAPTPTISGTARVGFKLRVTTGTWSPKATFTYRWYANGAAIPGATSSSYTLKSAQAGKKITVKVTGSKGGYTSVAKTSRATLVVRR